MEEDCNRDVGIPRLFFTNRAYTDIRTKDAALPRLQTAGFTECGGGKRVLTNCCCCSIPTVCVGCEDETCGSCDDTKPRLSITMTFTGPATRDWLGCEWTNGETKEVCPAVYDCQQYRERHSEGWRAFGGGGLTLSAYTTISTIEGTSMGEPTSYLTWYTYAFLSIEAPDGAGMFAYFRQQNGSPVEYGNSTNDLATYAVNSSTIADEAPWIGDGLRFGSITTNGDPCPITITWERSRGPWKVDPSPLRQECSGDDPSMCITVCKGPVWQYPFKFAGETFLPGETKTVCPSIYFEGQTGTFDCEKKYKCTEFWEAGNSDSILRLYGYTNHTGQAIGTDAVEVFSGATAVQTMSLDVRANGATFENFLTISASNNRPAGGGGGPTGGPSGGPSGGPGCNNWTSTYYTNNVGTGVYTYDISLGGYYLQRPLKGVGDGQFGTVILNNGTEITWQRGERWKTVDDSCKEFEDCCGCNESTLTDPRVKMTVTFVADPESCTQTVTIAGCDFLNGQTREVCPSSYAIGNFGNTTTTTTTTTGEVWYKRGLRITAENLIRDAVALTARNKRQVDFRITTGALNFRFIGRYTHSFFGNQADQYNTLSSTYDLDTAGAYGGPRDIFATEFTTAQKYIGATQFGQIVSSDGITIKWERLSPEEAQCPGTPDAWGQTG